MLCFFSLTAVGAWECESRNELGKNWGSFLSMATSVLFFMEKKLRFLSLQVLLTPSSVLGPLPGFTWQTYSYVLLLFDFEKYIRIHFLHLSKSYEMSYCVPFRIVAPGHAFTMKLKWWKSGSAQQSQDCGWIWQKWGIRNFIPLGKGISICTKMYFFTTFITAALY